jgi:hypothetical protein
MYTRLTPQGRSAVKILFWCVGVPVICLFCLVAFGLALDPFFGKNSPHQHQLDQLQKIYDDQLRAAEIAANRTNDAVLANSYSQSTARPVQPTAAPAPAAYVPPANNPPPQPNHGLMYNQTSGFAPNQKTQQAGFVYPTNFNSGYQSGGHK